MGIKHLNKYLRNNCPDMIRSIQISELSGKKIAVDISIYLYKYEAEGALLENMYLLLSILRYYSIIPIFIFDGKPPVEKNALIQKRATNKVDAETEYKMLKEKLKDETNEENRQEIIEYMDQLKKKIIYITKEKTEKVKELIRNYGATYYDAPREADELCAMLVINKVVWACLSEDMDMFVYGCTRVIRYFSLMNHTGILYYTKGILEELELTQNEFREICVLSGTDYNIEHSKNINIFVIMKYYKKYKDIFKNADANAVSVSTSTKFYEWLNDTTDITIDLDLIAKINDMFTIKKQKHLEDYKKVSITNTTINYSGLEDILKDDWFIFV
jgi:5'-3' exonuclease